jgi:hypothetical protein
MARLEGSLQASRHHYQSRRCSGTRRSLKRFWNRRIRNRVRRRSRGKDVQWVRIVPFLFDLLIDDGTRFEYNGRQLKVHYDKFTQTGQAPTAPTSPSMTPAYAHQQPGQMVLPAGYTLEYGSAPSSPYGDYPPQLQMPMPHPQHMQSHILSPHYSLSRHPSANVASSLSREVSSLSESLQSTSLSGGEQRPPMPNKGSGNSTGSGSGSSKNASSSSHPHHPGPIALPPPPQVQGFSVPMHNMSPGMIPISPMYHPGMSPLHHPAMVPMTPHGLPPITPSMPPFTFMGPMPSPGAHPTTVTGQDGMQHQVFGLPQTPGGPPPFTLHMPPQPSPGFQPPQLYTPFSPGLTMSPGAFWGRPGMNGAGPNPYINPAVGAPVHVVQGSPGGFYMPVSPGHMTDMSAGIQAQEPRGYFDNYFGPNTPTSPSNGTTGGLAVEGEILKDRKEKKKSPLRGKTGIASPEDEGTPASTDAAGQPAARTSVKRTMSAGDAPKSQASRIQDEEAVEDDDDAPSHLEGFQRKNGAVDSTRTYSMSSSGSSARRPMLSRPDSDPARTNSTAPTSAVPSPEDELTNEEDKTPSNEVPSRIIA